MNAGKATFELIYWDRRYEKGKTKHHSTSFKATEGIVLTGMEFHVGQIEFAMRRREKNTRLSFHSTCYLYARTRA